MFIIFTNIIGLQLYKSKNGIMKVITNYKVNEGKEVEFSNFLTTNLFKQGFGILSKSEIDLILFAAILMTDDSIIVRTTN